MKSTIGKRSKAYLGLVSDEDGLTTAAGASIRRQVAIAVLLLSAGILIWVFWSAPIGGWLFFFSLIYVVIAPMVRRYQRKADQQRHK
jgi:hypothetical protein